MIWNKNLLYQINDVYHIKKLKEVNNEKSYKIEWHKRHRIIPQEEVFYCLLTWVSLSEQTEWTKNFRLPNKFLL